MRGLLAAPLACVALVITLHPVAAIAQEASSVSIPEVVARAAELDGRTVVIEGEAIGEALRADRNTVWVNVLGDGTAIGVWMPDEMARPIARWGGYRQTGDTVRVSGVVNMACDQHGGDLDVHATALEVIRRGAAREEEVRWRDALVGATGFMAAGVAYLVSHRRIRREPGGE